MKTIHSIYLIPITGLLLTFMSLSHAEDKLNSKALEKLISGNTVEEKNIQHGWENKIFFVTTGKFHRIDQNKNTEKGSWDIESDGSICLERRKRKCWTLMLVENNTYNVYSRWLDRHKKIWKIVSGNPYKL